MEQCILGCICVPYGAIEMKKLLFIYNLYAGKGTLRGRLAPILDALTEKWDVTVHPTRGAGDATAVARDRAGEFDRIVCSGGDGTLHEVVTGLMELSPEERPTVGYIPAGSTNDFAKNLNLPRTLEELAVVAAAGKPRPVDVGKFNDQDFLYVAAFGAFTDLSYNTPQQFKHIFGHLAYLMGVHSRLGSIKPYSMTVEHDGKVELGSYCLGFVSNTHSIAGIQANPGRPIALDDGLFEVMLVRQPKTLLQLQRILKALTNVESDDKGLVTCFRANKVRIISDQDLAWTLDGEYGGDHRVVEVTNCHQAVTIVYGA